MKKVNSSSGELLNLNVTSIVQFSNLVSIYKRRLFSSSIRRAKVVEAKKNRPERI